jgi:Competence-damaged protein
VTPGPTCPGPGTDRAPASLTGGLLASTFARASGSSEWFRGGVVAYSSMVKYNLLGVPAGPVVSEAAALAMARAATWPDRLGGAVLLRLSGSPADICERVCAVTARMLLGRLALTGPGPKGAAPGAHR